MVRGLAGDAKGSNKVSPSHSTPINSNKKNSPVIKALKQRTRRQTQFRGSIDELRSYYYDCANYQQADRFITTTKAISEHVGRTYKDPGDIRATLDNMVKHSVPMPVDPVIGYADITDSSGNVITAREQVTYMENMIARQEIQVYVKCKAALESNIQKAYSLVLGQCTEDKGYNRAKDYFKDLNFSVTKGSRYLGGFVGDSDMADCWAEDKIADWIEAVRILSSIAKHNPQCVFAGFQRSLQQEWQFLQRNVTLDNGNFDDLEDIIATVFLPSLFDTTIPPSKLTCLGVKEGGMGIPIPSNSCLSNRSSSLEMTSLIVDSIVNETDFLISSHDRHVKEVRKMNNRQRSEKGLEALKECTKDMDPHRCRIISRAPATGLWLSISPNALNGTELAPVEFRDSLSIRYGNTPSNLPDICDGCGGHNSLTHAMDCKHGGLIHQRHDEIKFELGDLAGLALSPGAVRDEPLITHCQYQHQGEEMISHENRGDLLIRGLWIRGEENILDVQITNLDSPSHIERKDENVLLSLENRKKSKYERDCNDIRRSFSPYVSSVDGLCGDSAKGIQRRLAVHLSKKWKKPYSAVCAYVRARLNIALIRATNRCIRGSRIPFKMVSSKYQRWEDGVGLCLFR